MSEQLDRFVAAGQAMMTGDWDGYGAVLAEDVAMRAPGVPGVTTGRAARVEMAQGFQVAFPGFRVEIEHAFEEGDRACVVVRFVGTHTGPMPTPDGTTIEPTGRPVDFRYCMVIRFEDGVAAELDEFYDQLELLTQLGVA